MDDRLHPVAGTPFDFQSPEDVGRRMAAVGSTPPGYDNCYALDMASPRWPVGASASVCAVPAIAYAGTLRHAGSGRAMLVHTTKPGVQLYTANYLGGPAPFSRHSALCLETQYFPDSPNVASWPSPVLRPGVVYKHVSVHSFSW